eukprot:1148465-Amorphochlora_amoeboformis.AAC.1
MNIKVAIKQKNKHHVEINQDTKKSENRAEIKKYPENSENLEEDAEKDGQDVLIKKDVGKFENLELNLCNLSQGFPMLLEEVTITNIAYMCDEIWI